MQTNTNENINNDNNRGVLSWIAGVYTLVAQYITLHPPHLTSLEFYLIVTCGMFFVSTMMGGLWMVYHTDL